jgi:predicted transcriptional regulator
MPTLPSASLRLDARTESRLLRLAETRQQSADTLMREAIEQSVPMPNTTASIRRPCHGEENDPSNSY